MDLKNAAVIVFTYPDHKVNPELMKFLITHGADWDRFVYTRAGGRCVEIGYNAGVMIALGLDADEIVFADNDIWPQGDATEPFLEDKGKDVVCVQYPTECKASGWLPTEFHCGLWRIKRDALLKIPTPHFAWPVNQTASEIRGCPCGYFSVKAQQVGLKVGWQGFAGHPPRRPDGFSDVVVGPGLKARKAAAPQQEGPPKQVIPTCACTGG